MNLAIKQYEARNKEWFEIFYEKGYEYGENEYSIEEHFIRLFATDLIYGKKIDLRQAREDYINLGRKKFFEKYKSKLDPNENEKHLQWFTFNKIKKILMDVGLKILN